jgi:type VI protein secretion system component Hcp
MKRNANDENRLRYEYQKEDLDEADEKATDARWKGRFDNLDKDFKTRDIERLNKEYQALAKKADSALTDAERAKRGSLASDLAGLLKQQGEAIDELKSDAEKMEDEKREKWRRRERGRIDREKSAEADYASKNFQFKFSKRVDAATTQLLNCMKAGDLLPTVTLSMYQASSNTPWSLVITVTKVRLLKYTLRVEATDTMTDMREDWEAEFASFGYVYQNRPHAGVKSLTAGHANTAVARGMTQSTVRTFLMKNMDFF